MTRAGQAREVTAEEQKEWDVGLAITSSSLFTTTAPTSSNSDLRQFLYLQK
jgi:hypothetical protein